MLLKRLSSRLPGLLLLICTIPFFVGCVTSKNITYFQEAADLRDSLLTIQRYVPSIRPGDVLSIQVSSLNPESSVIFNPYAMQAAAATATAQQGGMVALPQMYGYLVASNGSIEFPLIGSIRVGGLTTEQAGTLIRQQLTTYLKEPTVNVRNQNFRISVLGEVARPSLFVIPNDRVTLPEALSLAGDVTIQGRRDNVLIIREEGETKRFYRVDLTKRGLFSSPYYYLHPNDVVYVEPGKSRIATSDRTYQILPIVLSGLSLLTILVVQLGQRL